MTTIPTTITIVAVIALLAFCGGWDIAKKRYCNNAQAIADTIVVYRCDTIVVEKPTQIVRYVQRYDTITKSDTIKMAILGDSTAIIPIERAIYQDSVKNAKYTAYLSGFRPVLDSIHIESLITELTITKEKPQKRFGFGIQAGIGATKGGFSPYIGVGVQYRLW